MVLVDYFKNYNMIAVSGEDKVLQRLLFCKVYECISSITIGVTMEIDWPSLNTFKVLEIILFCFEIGSVYHKSWRGALSQMELIILTEIDQS